MVHCHCLLYKGPQFEFICLKAAQEPCRLFPQIFVWLHRTKSSLATQEVAVVNKLQSHKLLTSNPFPASNSVLRFEAV